jgi:cobalt-zinc-cadmium resistance protein CzcA
LPVITLSGVEGKMFRPMALVVLLALTGAVVLTFTVVPALAALLLSGRVAERDVFLIRWAKAIYQPIVHWAIRLRFAVSLGALALVVATLVLASRMGSEFIPKLGEGALALQPTRMPSIALTTSVEMQERVEQELLKEFPDEISAIFARTGTSEVVTDVCGPEISDTYMMLKPREQWKKARTQEELAEAMERVVQDLPGQNYEFSQPIELRMNELIAGVRSDLAIKIYGDELDVLLRYANRVAEELKAVPGAEDLKIEQLAGMPMITIDIDRGAVARYGLNVQDVQEVVEIALGGMEAGRVLEGDRRFELVVRMPERLRENIRAIGDLPIPLPKRDAASYALASTSGGGHGRTSDELQSTSAGYIPLSSLAKIEISEGARIIRREDGKRRAVVQCNVRGRDLGGFVAEASSGSNRRSASCPKATGWGGVGSTKTSSRHARGS